MRDSEHLLETKDSYESSVQKVESDLETKNINAVDENNPLARGLGSTGSQERTMNIEIDPDEYHSLYEWEEGDKDDESEREDAAENE